MEFSQNCNRLLALTLLPADDIVDAFVEMKPTFPDRCDELVSYFERTYIGRMVNGRWRAPLFPHSTWTCYDRLKAGVPRTSNWCEVTNNALKNAFGRFTHPTVYRFTRIISTWLWGRCGDLAAAAVGQQNHRTSEKYKVLTTQLLSLIRRFDDAGYRTVSRYMVDGAKKM